MMVMSCGYELWRVICLLLYCMAKDMSDALRDLCQGKSQEGIQNGRIQVLRANSHCQQCTNKCTAVYTYLMSQQMEMAWYYLEFPECWKIKRMHMQTVTTWPFFPILNGHEAGVLL